MRNNLLQRLLRRLQESKRLHLKSGGKNRKPFYRVKLPSHPRPKLPVPLQLFCRQPLHQQKSLLVRRHIPRTNQLKLERHKLKPLTARTNNRTRERHLNPLQTLPNQQNQNEAENEQWP